VGKETQGRRAEQLRLPAVWVRLHATPPLLTWPQKPVPALPAEECEAKY
jgi:hypothetical protein